MEEGIKDINDDNNEIYDEEKEAECLDDTSPVEMEESLKYRKDDKDEKMTRRNMQNYQMTLPLLI